jgi:hypothetical protein
VRGYWEYLGFWGFLLLAMDAFLVLIIIGGCIGACVESIQKDKEPAAPPSAERKR